MRVQKYQTYERSQEEGEYRHKAGLHPHVIPLRLLIVPRVHITRKQDACLTFISQGLSVGNGRIEPSPTRIAPGQFSRRGTCQQKALIFAHLSNQSLLIQAGDAERLGT